MLLVRLRWKANIPATGERNRKGASTEPTLTLVVGDQFIGEYAGAHDQNLRDRAENSPTVYQDSLNRLFEHPHLKQRFEIY